MIRTQNLLAEVDRQIIVAKNELKEAQAQNPDNYAAGFYAGRLDGLFTAKALIMFEDSLVPEAVVEDASINSDEEFLYDEV